MSLVKFKPAVPYDMFEDFSKVFDSFFNREVQPFVNRNAFPAVNVVENEESFVMDLVAPGRNKTDFNINLNGDLLTISYEQKDEKNESEGKFTRREFHFSSFKRTFTLPEHIEAEAISARYEDGVLKVTLPKKAVAPKAEIKTIEIG